MLGQEGALCVLLPLPLGCLFRFLGLSEEGGAAKASISSCVGGAGRGLAVRVQATLGGAKCESGRGGLPWGSKAKGLSALSDGSFRD